jgi:hypothetical protein
MHGSGRQHSTSITPGGGHACDAEPTAWAHRSGRQGRTGGTASTPSQPAWEGGHDHATARYSAHDSEAHRRVTARTNLSKKTQHNAGRRGRKPAIAGNFFSRPYPTKVRAYLATHFSAFSLLPSVMATLRLSAEPIPPAPVKRMMAPTKPPSALLRSAGTEAVPECGDTAHRCQPRPRRCAQRVPRPSLTCIRPRVDLKVGCARRAGRRV